MENLNGDRAAAMASAVNNTSDHSMSTGPQEKEPDTCLKCGNKIVHIPYKYNGQTFHARCLVCNYCGKKLIGKPFITDKNLIFCGDQCKQGFEQNPCKVQVLNDSKVNQENTDNEALSESLMDALESIQESQQDILRLNRQASPLQKMQDPDRITDYPRGPSPNVSMLSLSSRRSSLSAMSQSSLTSDSSFDASKKPGKNILKNPHRPQRRSRNRVRWKLPNSDSDTLSVDSYESSSTVSSSVYNRARNGVLTAKQNWRDFEQSPPKGSTGITPIKPSSHQMRGSFSTGTLHSHHYSPPSRLSTIPQDAVISDLGSKPHQTWTTSKPTSSPLKYNTSANNSLSPGGVLHSTPMRYSQSTSDIDFHRKMQLHPAPSPNANADTDFPILRLDSSNLTDLEESTLEDKKRMHIFQFPQSSQQPQHSGRSTLQSPESSRSKQSAPTTAVTLLDDDDANDYDHLSPLHQNKTKKQEKQKKNDDSIYSDEDLDDALEVIAKELQARSSESPGSSRTKEVQPPLVPPKKHPQGRKAAIGSEATGYVHQADSIKPTPAPAPIMSILAQQQSTSHTDRGLKGNDSRKGTSRSQQAPPPVPPKMRRMKQQNNMIPSSNQLSSQAYPPSKEAYLPSQEAYQTSQEAYLPSKEAYQPSKAAYQPSQEAYLPSKAAYQPSQEAYLPSKEAYQPSKAAYQPSQEAYLPSKAAYQPSQEAYLPSKAAYQPSQEAYLPSKEVYQPSKEAYLQSKEAYLAQQKQYKVHVQENKSFPPPLKLSTERPTGVRKTSPTQSHASTDEDPMSSVSNTTLVEQEDTTPKSSKFNSAAGPAVVYPAISQQRAESKQSWRGLGLRDRIVEGEEDPGPPVDRRLKSSTSLQFQNSRSTTSKFSPPQNLYNQSSSQGMQYLQDSTFFMGTCSQPDTRSSDFMVTSNYSKQVHGGRTNSALEEKLTVPTSPRYKISLETALTEGNLLKGLSYEPQNHSTSASQPNERNVAMRNQQIQRPHRSIPRSNSVGQNPRPAGSIDASLISEEQQVRQRFYSSGKLPMDKPVVHVKSQSVSQLLRELEINDKKPAASVMCNVCKKTIQGSSYTMRGENYHSRCYKCAICGSMLRGKKSFAVNHRLYCKDCHSRKNFSLPGPEIDGNTLHQDQYRRNLQSTHENQRQARGSGRQMTSV